VNSPSPGSFPKHKTHVHSASSPTHGNPYRSPWTHCVLHIKNDRTLSILQAQPPLRISRQHAEEQEELSLSAQQVSRRRQLSRHNDDPREIQVSRLRSSKRREAKKRYSTHFEVISPVVAADSGRCKVFVSQHDLDDSSEHQHRCQEQSSSSTLTEKAQTKRCTHLPDQSPSFSEVHRP
jgi:hypothetical protein